MIGPRASRRIALQRAKAWRNRTIAEQGKHQATNLRIQEEICGMSKNVAR
jgi:hypothetical protein